MDTEWMADKNEDPPSIDEAWRVEIAKRIADVNSGKVTAIPWAEARRKIDEVLQPKKKLQDCTRRK